jgi:hypothetical protein
VTTTAWLNKAAPWSLPYFVAIAGFAVGWIVRGWFDGEPPISAPAMLAALVSIVVGWQIQSGLKKQGELSKIPIDAVSELCKRVDDLIVECLNHSADTKAEDPKLVEQLRSLSNEVDWLCAIAETCGCDAALTTLTKNSYQELYESATLQTTYNAVSAGKAGRRLRARALMLQWHICHHVMKSFDSPGKLERLLTRLDG